MPNIVTPGIVLMDVSPSTGKIVDHRRDKCPILLMVDCQDGRVLVAAHDAVGRKQQCGRRQV
jgi:hypothetical protein